METIDRNRGSPSRAEKSSDRDFVQEVSDWLVGQGLRTAGFETMFAGFCERLASAGIRVWRGNIGMRTLHPSVEAIAYSWRPGIGIQAESVLHDDRESEETRNSPFMYILENGLLQLRIRLDRPGSGPNFPLLDEFRRGGATDYYASLVAFDFPYQPADGVGVLSSWTTDRPGGFTDADIAILDRLLPRLGLSLKATLTWQIAGNVLDAYVGPDAGRRILGGSIRRGEAEIIRAVLLFADLQGFTAASDAIPREALLGTLDSYLDCMVGPLVERGGEVLKFMGDGLLAAFELGTGPRDTVCRQALDAALDALSRVGVLNGARARDGLPTLPLHVALHLGDVLYGNIGARGRQDFTVIGPAVNEASRIEELCGVLGHDLLLSSAFADAATACRGRLLPLGQYSLRGVPERQALYTVDPIF